MSEINQLKQSFQEQLTSLRTQIDLNNRSGRIPEVIYNNYNLCLERGDKTNTFAAAVALRLYNKDEAELAKYVINDKNRKTDRIPMDERLVELIRGYLSLNHHLLYFLFSYLLIYLIFINRISGQKVQSKTRAIRISMAKN